jgi:hypothetical protein
MRNVGVLQEVLSGKSFAECATKFSMSNATIATSIRSILRHLKEYTSIDIEESSNYEYLHSKKEEIKKSLAEPFPTVLISPSAKDFLLKTFGKDYARRPKDIAAKWQEIKSNFNMFTARRELQSIQKWLASEGHLVGDMVTDDMFDFVFSALRDQLLSMDIQHEKHSLVIEKFERSQWKNRFIVQAKISEQDHQVTRRFAIELLPS